VQVGNLAYDETKKELVGFGGIANADGSYSKTLESMKAAGAGKFTFRTIGKVPVYTGEMGPITTVDSRARVHYSLLAPPPKPWEKSDGCAATGFPCKAGTSCCMMPPGECKHTCIDTASCCCVLTWTSKLEFALLVGLCTTDSSFAEL